MIAPEAIWDDEGRKYCSNEHKEKFLAVLVKKQTYLKRLSATPRRKP